MPIILLSEAPHGRGLELAERVASRTGWGIYSRQQLADDAHDQGIKLSRLETSIIKTPIIADKLAREKELYLSFVIDTLLKKAVNGNLIYFGRAGHLLMAGVSHMIRVGISVPMETRIENAIKELHLSREKAVDYLQSLDQDIEKWTHYVHRQSLNDPSRYDLFLNLRNVSLENAADLICSTAALPEFQPTAASLKRQDELHLTARARLHLSRNRETSDLSLGIRASGGVVTVTYMPRQEQAARSISRVLEGLEDCRENVCTIAETTLLYIQERFDPKADDFARITQLAKRWGAAVELLRLVPGPDGTGHGPVPLPLDTTGDQAGDLVYTGGVEDDIPEADHDDGGLAVTREELLAMGRSAGCYTVAGGTGDLLEAINRNNRYSLVILGDLFLAKGEQSRIRLTRELGISLKEALKAPVITADELESRFLFGKPQAMKLAFYTLAVMAIYWLVFTFQRPILEVLGGDLHERLKWVAAIGVALFVPLVAYCYSTVTGLLLKLIDID